MTEFRITLIIYWQSPWFQPSHVYRIKHENARLNYSTWIYKCFASNYQFYSIGEEKKNCIFNNIEGRSEKMHRLCYAVCIHQNLFKNFMQQACCVNLRLSVRTTHCYLWHKRWWKWGFSFMHQPVYSHRMSHQYSLQKRLDGP